ncbi:MAG: hypothetical protein U9Q84_00210 [Thermodesulfobacteriota bacterium]|nr:hypothetical protein [Thermodesulfobacteriota bacterium]
MRSVTTLTVIGAVTGVILQTPLFQLILVMRWTVTISIQKCQRIKKMVYLSI